MPVKVVVDTSVIVSGLAFPRGNPFVLIEHWRSGAFVLVTSKQQLSELAIVLNRPKLSKHVGPTDAQLMLRLIENEAEFASVETIERRVRDPNDDVILATALVGKADFLVTGDRDLLVLARNQEFVPLQIISVVEFLTENDDLLGPA